MCIKGRAMPWARRNLGFQPALFEFRDTLTFVSIDIVAWTSHYIYIMELKLSNNGGVLAAEKQIKDCGYMEPFKAYKRDVVALAVELDAQGKGLVGWKRVE